MNQSETVVMVPANEVHVFLRQRETTMDFSGRKLFLAPLAGITDSVFRTLCREHGADVVMSEMVSAEGLYYKSRATDALLNFEKQERPIGIQLFGAKPDHMARAAEHVQKKADPDFIDLNSGCPVPKVVKKNGGASLLKDIRLFKELVSTMVKAVSVPVSVKIRSGWSEHQWVDVEFAQAAVECGASAIILHPRSKSMGFSGHSYWERIGVVKKSVDVPVVGNGDILLEQDALDMFSQTDCDSIMIGRGALGNPWIFSRIKALLSHKPVSLPTSQERIEMAFDHIRRYKKTYGEKKAAAETKKHVSWYIRGLPGASGARSRIFRSRTTGEIAAALEELLPGK
jgi:tRNA-dihydrouridine synthase B